MIERNLNFNELIQLSKDLYAEGKTEDAVEILTYCQRSYSAEALPLDLLGDIFFSKENYQIAHSYYLKSIQLLNNNVATLRRLGLIELNFDRPESAKKYFESALSLDPRDFQSLINMANFYQQTDNYDTALKYYLDAYSINPKNALCLTNIGKIYFQNKNWEQALRYLEQSQQIEPNSAVVNFLVRFLKREKSKDLPIDFIEELFDDYSPNFEKHLTQTLDYQAPKVCIEMIHKNIIKDQNTKLKILDLGCGTGLIAEYFSQEDLPQIDGVDISQKMLDQAARKNLYASLTKMDLLQYLEVNKSLHHDIIVICDVINYIGDLENFFQLISRSMKKGAHIVMSSEDKLGDNFVLSENLRFQHSSKYIETLTQKYGLEVLCQSPEELRKQDNKPVSGIIWLLKKN